MSESPEIFKNILQNLEKVIRGKSEVLQQILVAFFAGGHILLEDVPGVGKTTLAKALAISVDSSFKRVQFTPDLLPGDIIGINVYQPKTGEFQFRQGPIFSDILLADEINRASPRTQSALLEAMSEHQATVEGKTIPLGDMFTVIATQNSVEFHGTYPLPEAQLDRFFMKTKIGYPNREYSITMLRDQQQQHPLQSLKSVATSKEVLEARKQVRAVNVNDRVCQYIMDIIEKSRSDSRIKLGISPRGCLSFYRAGQAFAWSQGRDYVLPDDMKRAAPVLLSHRVVLETKIRHSSVGQESLIQEILTEIPVPV